MASTLVYTYAEARHQYLLDRYLLVQFTVRNVIVVVFLLAFKLFTCIQVDN